MREAALRMNALADDLPGMARVGSGRIALNLQWQPLEEVVGSEGGERFVFTPPRGEPPRIDEPVDGADNASMEAAA